MTPSKNKIMRRRWRIATLWSKGYSLVEIRNILATNSTEPIRVCEKTLDRDIAWVKQSHMLDLLDPWDILLKIHLTMNETLRQAWIVYEQAVRVSDKINALGTIVKIVGSEIRFYISVGLLGPKVLRPPEPNLMDKMMEEAKERVLARRRQQQDSPKT